MRILVVDEEQMIRELVRATLLYDTLALRLDPSLKVNREFQKYDRQRERRKARRRRRRPAAASRPPPKASR